MFFFFKQKTAYELRISDWSSDVCSSDLPSARLARGRADPPAHPRRSYQAAAAPRRGPAPASCRAADYAPARAPMRRGSPRSEEHTSELQSLIRISYAVFCLKKKKKEYTHQLNTNRKDTKNEN